MSYAVPSSPDEKRWRAEEDARNLAETERIKEDPDRLAAAKAMAKIIAEEDSKRTAAMRKVASKKTPAINTPKKRVVEKRVLKKPAKPGNNFNVFERI